jgi:hypothetical protein
MRYYTRTQSARSGGAIDRAIRLMLATLLALVLVGASAGCLVYDIDRHAGAAWTATAAAAPPTSTAEPTAVPPTRTLQPTAAPSRTSTPRPLPTATQEKAPSALDTIFARTSELRGLRPGSAVPLGYLTPAELQSYLDESLERENAREQMESDKAILALLELIGERDDLYGLYLDAMTEQVAGFYDLDTKEMKLISRAQSPAPLDELVLVHEYVHALQDQNFDIGRKLKDVKGDSERSLALHSVLEGDATLFMSLYAQRYFTPAQMADLASQTPGGPSGEKLKRAPPVLEWQMMFPYMRGVAFVATAFQSGGIPAINRLYSNPPLNSTHIMHPEKYARGELAKAIRKPDLAPALGPGWSVATEDVMGEFGFWCYLRGGLSEADAGRGSDGWAGDRLMLLRDQAGRHVLAVISAWVSPAEAQDFYQSLQRLRATRPGAPVTALDSNRMRWTEPSRSGYAAVSGDEVLLIVGPTAGIVDQIVRVASR